MKKKKAKAEGADSAKKFRIKISKKLIIWAAAVILIIGLLILGLNGGKEAKRVTQVCDIGVGDGHILCWKWRQGTDSEILENLFGPDAQKIVDSWLKDYYNRQQEE